MVQDIIRAKGLKLTSNTDTYVEEVKIWIDGQNKEKIRHEKNRKLHVLYVNNRMNTTE